MSIGNHSNNRRSARVWVLVIAVMALTLALAACGSSESKSEAKKEASPYEGKKVLWVDSYHSGYAWSDGIEASLRGGLDGTGIDLRVVHMDTKNNPSVDFGNQAGQDAKAVYDEFEPDVVVACDDNAQKYLVVPFLREGDTPVVFCGVNWDATIYGYPTANVTGMVEVDLAEQIFDHLKEYAAGETIGYLAGDTETDRKISSALNERFYDGAMKTYFATSFAQFQELFVQAQQEVDILMVYNNAGILDWDEAAAITFFNENTSVPTGTHYAWMTPYALITLNTLPEEQGAWSAETVLQILDGTAVSDIPVVENKRGDLTLNLDIAATLDITFSPQLLKIGHTYPAATE